MSVSDGIARNRRSAVVDVLKGFIYAVDVATMLSLVNFPVSQAGRGLLCPAPR